MNKSRKDAERARRLAESATTDELRRQLLDIAAELWPEDEADVAAAANDNHALKAEAVSGAPPRCRAKKKAPDVDGAINAGREGHRAGLGALLEHSLPAE